MGGELILLATSEESRALYNKYHAKRSRQLCVIYYEVLTNRVYIQTMRKAFFHQ